jgi:hypothetical protein
MSEPGQSRDGRWLWAGVASLVMTAGCPGGEGGTTEAASTTATTGTGAQASTSTGAVTTGEATTGDTTTGDTTSESDGSGTSSTTDATGETGSTGTTGEPVCPCILDEHDEGWGHAPSLPICGEELCPKVHVKESELYPDGILVDDPAILECMLTALRDRTPGLLTWGLSRESGVVSMSGYVLIQADGTAIRRDWGSNDLTYIVDDARASALPEPSTFSQCLTDESEHARYDCAVRFPTIEPSVVCDERWVNYDYGW